MTHTFVLKGFTADGKTIFPRPCELVLRYTEDERGKTLSISDNNGVMLGVPVDGILQLMEEAHAENRSLYR